MLRKWKKMSVSHADRYDTDGWRYFHLGRQQWRRNRQGQMEYARDPSWYAAQAWLAPPLKTRGQHIITIMGCSAIGIFMVVCFLVGIMIMAFTILSPLFL